MDEALIIRHCAPTLAGLKVASLYNSTFEQFDAFLDELESFNDRFALKDIRLRFLRLTGTHALVYLYRPQVLAQILAEPEIRQFLGEYGYTRFDAEGALSELSQKFCVCASFPHEIGIFLGYPLDDVKDFIKNSGKNCRLCGCWKVYHHEDAAKKAFDCFDRCSHVYQQRFDEGFALDKLAVNSAPLLHRARLEKERRA